MKITNFNYIIPSTGFDIIHREKTESNEKITQSAKLTLEVNGKECTMKFELPQNNKINERDFLLVSETNILFYCGNIE